VSRRRLPLAVWAGRPQAPDPARLTLADVLYAPPNPDMTRKRCGNCLLWLGARGEEQVVDREECFIHAADVVVIADMVCGYHVFGVPMGSDVPPREGVVSVLPEHSGLCQPEDGSACELCEHFTAGTGRTGLCNVAFEEDVDHDGDPMHAVVEVNGCCAAWRERAEEV
jgi:hypothetical protein